jgi:predicted nucleotidyltransferase
MGLHYYLIGANARDIQLYKSGKKPSRGTRDIDFAVMLPDHASFDEFKEVLFTRGFEAAHGNQPFRIYHKESNTVVDLVPYGQIALDSTISFADRKVELSVLGMEEVGAQVEAFQHPDGYSIPVSPAQGIVILKFIAWSERPDRTKDLTDIADLLDSAWSLNEYEAYIDHLDLFEDNFDEIYAGPRIIGRKMQVILAANSQLEERMLKMITSDLSQEVGPISRAIVNTSKKTVEQAKQILKNLLKGITEESQV